MSNDHSGHSHDRHGGFGRRQNWRDNGDRSWRGRENGHSSRRDAHRGDARSFGERDDRRGGFNAKGGHDFSDRRNGDGPRRSDEYSDRPRYSRERGNSNGSDFGRRNKPGDSRQDRRPRNFDDHGEGRFSRESRGSSGQRNNWRRDDSGRADFKNREDRRHSHNRRERPSRSDDWRRNDFTRNDSSGQRDKRGERRFAGREGRRNDRRAPQGDAAYENFSSTAEYVSPNPNEPRIPAGVSAEELDPQALRALSTLSGPNRDIVARHLVMAGQLVDLDPEEAYAHAAAAASRAGRVDVVREAAALTAYASGRYEEALREVRAVRRMRGDDALRAVEADCERGLGHADKAVEIIDKTNTQGLDLAEQVELVLVSSGARADLGQNDVGLVIVDDALAALPADTDPFLLARLMTVKVDRLRELGRNSEADEVEAAIPDVEEDPEIVDLSFFADVDVDNKRTALRGMDTPLVEAFDAALLDLDGTAWNGDNPIEHAAASILEVREQGMNTVFLTNNAMRTPEQVADKLNSMGFEADPATVMTSAMDVIAIMKEHIDDGSKVFAIGGAGLRHALEDAGYILVDSADENPQAVVQGLDVGVDWSILSEGAFAIERGARYFATNLDASLPQERGFALGNGALVRAIQATTHVRAIAAGKPEPGIYLRGAALVDATTPIAVGDRLETDIAGAVAASVPSMHVLTGVHGARDVIRAPRGQRPSFLALDMRGLLEDHPRAKHHLDGTWTCGESQVVKVARKGNLMVDDIELVDSQDYTVTLDTYRALAAASWDYADEKGGPVHCPTIHVVENSDPAGVVEPPVTDSGADGGFDAEDESLGQEADTLTENAEVPAFLPGEEDLEELLAHEQDEDEASEL